MKMKDFIVEIYDIKGMKRLTKENIRSINTDGLENGMYHVKIISKIDLSYNIYKLIIWR